MLHFLQGIQHVLHLGFDHVHHGTVPKAGVRAHQHEEVGEAGHRGALVGFRTLAPGIEQVLAATAENHAPGNRLLGLEAGAVHDAVHLTFSSVVIHNGVAFHFTDAIGEHIHVILVQRRVVVVGDQHPLAAEVEIRRDFLAQRLVLDLVADVAAGLQLTDFQDAWVTHKAQHPGFQHPVDALTEGIQGLREFAEHHPLQRADFPVRLGHDPRRRALVQVQVGGIPGNLRHKLDSRSAGADHRHSLAAKIIVVVPVLGVEASAGERLHTLDIRVRRRAQAAHAGHQHLGVQFAEFGQGFVAAIQRIPGLEAVLFHIGPKLGAVAGFDGPGTGSFIPAGTGYVGVKLDVFDQAVLFRAVAQVGFDLRLGGEHPAPVGVLFEGEGVQGRLHVAGAAGVVVFVPGAADVVALFEDHKVVKSCFFEFDGHAEAGEAGADDGDLGGLCHCCTPVWPVWPCLLLFRWSS